MNYPAGTFLRALAAFEAASWTPYYADAAPSPMRRVPAITPRPGASQTERLHNRSPRHLDRDGRAAAIAVGLGIPSRAPIAERARPIVQAATRGSSALLRQLPAKQLAGPVGPLLAELCRDRQQHTAQLGRGRPARESPCASLAIMMKLRAVCGSLVFLPRDISRYRAARSAVFGDEVQRDGGLVVLVKVCPVERHHDLGPIGDDERNPVPEELPDVHAGVREEPVHLPGKAVSRAHPSESRTPSPSTPGVSFAFRATAVAGGRFRVTGGP